MRRGLKELCLRAGSIIVLLVLWWACAKLINDPEVLPGPIAIGRTIVKNFGMPGPEGESAYFDVGITLARIFTAFAAAMVAGISIGLAMGLNRLFERSLLTVIPLMLTIPTILMVFLAVMWFGYTEFGALVAVMAVVTPYVAVNMYEGTRAMDKSLIDMAITFKASRLLRLRGVYLPQLLPYIFAAFRYAFAITWKIVALAETFGLKFGIGYMFYFWFQQFNMTQVLAWIIMFVVCMLLLEHLIFARLEKRAFAWRSSRAYTPHT